MIKNKDENVSLTESLYDNDKTLSQKFKQNFVPSQTTNDFFQNLTINKLIIVLKTLNLLNIFFSNYFY